MRRLAQILARVYMARSDVGYMVRTAALHVWKTLVTNTPRTLSEILPYLMDNIIQSLASTGEERQQMAGSCLGELVRKMGDRVLRQIIPILQSGMRDPLPGTRVGVCTGLKELLENVSQGQLMEHLPQLLPTVQAALVDTDAEVRQVRAPAAGCDKSDYPSLLLPCTRWAGSHGMACPCRRPAQRSAFCFAAEAAAQWTA